MPKPTALHRLYFVAVGTFAVWVGLWGYLFPAEIARAIPWPVPPLHARFLGAMYLSGACLMLGSLLATRLDQVAIPLTMAYVWTGMLGIVSFLHLDAFDFAHRPVWVWFFAYVVYPLAGAWLAWRLPAGGISSPTAETAHRSARVMAVQGLVCLGLAVALFAMPQTMTGIWPWTITPLLAQIYAGPLASYGIGSLLVARQAGNRATVLPLLSMIVFAGLVLVASLLHRQLFNPVEPATIVWFTGFGLALLAMTIVLLHTMRREDG